MDITIIGTGAMATLFAGFLARASYNVTMLGSWSAAIETINKHGIRLITGDTSEVYRVKAVTELPEIETAIILVKSWQTRKIAQLLNKSLNQDGICVTLQNGLGNDLLLKEAIGDKKVIRGITTYGATLIKPGVVKLGGIGRVVLEKHPFVQPIYDSFKNAGLNTEITRDIDKQIWLKVLVNSVINPLTALLDIPNGALLQINEVKTIIEGLIKEGVAIAATQGYMFNPDEIIKTTFNVAHSTSQNKSSMLQDIKRGAPTEIDAINGYLYQIAKAHHINAPYNHIIWLLVKSITKKQNRRSNV